MKTATRRHLFWAVQAIIIGASLAYFVGKIGVLGTALFAAGLVAFNVAMRLFERWTHG